MARNAVIDDSVKDALLRFPTVDMIRTLFPDVKMRGRSIMCNPLRGEKNASLSCFLDYAGYPRWKDHATGESGDNIDFFRKAYPDLSYIEAVDRMAGMLLGRSALLDADAPVRVEKKPARPRRAAAAGSELRSKKITVLSAVPAVPGGTPEEYVSYWRSRGISDEVAARYLSYVIYESGSLKGRQEFSPHTGLPLVDGSGSLVLDDGRRDALGLPNAVGGWVLRSPDTSARKGFKGCSIQFPTFIRADGTAAPRLVRFFGEGDGVVSALSYDPVRCVLMINPGQGFAGVDERAASLAAPLMSSLQDQFLDPRTAAGLEACLDLFSAGVSSPSVRVVEGMFDALSLIEVEKMAGRGTEPGMDLVVLNSVSNIRWAVPFLSLHGEVLSYLDNDMRTSAGRNAFDHMVDEVRGYAARLGAGVKVMNASAFFYPYKDVNDWLKAAKGVAPRINERDVEKERREGRVRAAARKASPGRKTPPGGVSF